MKAYYAERNNLTWTRIEGKHSSAHKAKIAISGTERGWPTGIQTDNGIERGSSRYDFDHEVAYLGTNKVQADMAFKGLVREARALEDKRTLAAMCVTKPFERVCAHAIKSFNQEKANHEADMEKGRSWEDWAAWRLTSMIEREAKARMARRLMVWIDVTVREVPDNRTDELSEEEFLSHVERLLASVRDRGMPSFGSSNPIRFPIEYTVHCALRDFANRIQEILDCDVKQILAARKQ